ncbi:MAG TPA: mechanosensitive ion channel family protein [Gemmatimonadaceae bacterium]
MTLTPSTMISLALPLGFTLAGLVAGLLLRRAVFGRLARAAAATASRTDDIVVAALRGPVVLWCTVLGLYVATEVTTVSPGVTRVLQRTLLVLVIVSITWALARLAAAVVENAARGVASRLPSATLLTHLARLGVLGLGALILLQTLGVSITPLLTALGVGGLAVGLALQDTLANFFAGIHILTSRQVRPGDYVQLASGEEGYVQDVTWRYTTIRQLPNNLTIVPNAKLASAVLTNFYLPDKELAVLVPVSVSYDSDLPRVEAVTNAVSREVMREVPGGVPEFEPFIRYNAFGESSIAFTVILRGREYVDQHVIRHEFIKRLHRRYQQEGIEIPFPIRTVRLSPPVGLQKRP